MNTTYYRKRKTVTHKKELFQVVTSFETQHKGDDASAVQGEGDEPMVNYQWS